MARFFYRGIRIDLDGTLPGKLEFGPCFFASRYTPADCALMAAFDEGFMQGLCGDKTLRLEFGCRLTEGASRCAAHASRIRH